MLQTDFSTTELIETYADSFACKQNVVALSKSFAKVLPTKWSAIEMKLFFAFLENINWRESQNGNIVVWENAELGKRLGWDVSTPEKVKRFAKYASKTLKKMESESRISLKCEGFTGEEASVSTRLFFHIESSKTYTLVVFNNLLMPLFENLIKTRSYFTYWIEDIYKLNSKHGQALYLDFIKMSKSFGDNIDELDFTTRQLKNIFSLDKDAYVTDGKFNRNQFEKRTIDKAIEEVSKTQLIEIIPFEDGALYFKEKNGRKVERYKFKYRIRKELLKSENGSYWFNKDSFESQKELNDAFRDKLSKKKKVTLEEEEPSFYGDGRNIKIKFDEII